MKAAHVLYTHLYYSILLYTHLYYSILLYTHLYYSILLYTHLYYSILLYTHLYYSILLYLNYIFLQVDIYTDIYNPCNLPFKDSCVEGVGRDPITVHRPS